MGVSEAAFERRKISRHILLNYLISFIKMFSYLRRPMDDEKDNLLVNSVGIG
jgi:hypothetical protein